MNPAQAERAVVAACDMAIVNMERGQKTRIHAPSAKLANAIRRALRRRLRRYFEGDDAAMAGAWAGIEIRPDGLCQLASGQLP